MAPRLQRPWPRRDDLPPHRRSRPLFAPAVVTRVVATVRGTEPVDHGLLGRGWTLKKLRQWVVDINWFGAYDFSDGECLIWAVGACNKETTCEFLRRIDDWTEKDGREVVVIWDGAPWHRAKVVQQMAAELGVTVVALPGYSPDLNPIEGLWKWMREAVTQHHCPASVRDLFAACKQFLDEINRDPLAIVQRLWPRFDLDPEVEKLGISN